MIIHSIGIKHDPSVVVYLSEEKINQAKLLQNWIEFHAKKQELAELFSYQVLIIAHPSLRLWLLSCITQHLPQFYHRALQYPSAKINLYSCSFVLCDAVMRVKVLIRGPFTDLAIGAIPVHSSRQKFIKYRNRSGKLWQLFAIFNLIFCSREKQNRLIIVCQSTITLFWCSEAYLPKKQKEVQCLVVYRRKSDSQSAIGAIPVQRLNTGIAPSPSRPSRVWKESRRRLRLLIHTNNSFSGM